MAELEGLSLDSLNLNDGTTYLLRGLEMPDPKKKQEWASSGDSDGAALIRDPLFENRTITAKIEVQPQSTMNLALDKVGAIGDKLEEAERRELNNLLALVWTPATSARTLTFYLQSGEIEELPREMSGDDAGYFQFSPIITVRFDCLPAGYEAEATVTGVSSTLPLQEFTVADVRGDMPAEARLIVTDAATQNRRHVEWGLENLTLVAASSLTLDSDSLVTSGFAGTGTTRTGAYDPGAAGNSVVRGTLVNTAQAITGTGNLGHIGSYKVKARVWASSLGVSLRFAYRDGDGALRRLPWVTPPVEDAFAEVELGEISIAKAVSGTQRWSGQVEAKSTTSGDTVDVDYLLFIPTERYGIARAPFVLETSPIFSAQSDFTTESGAITGDSLGIGGTWSGSGDADDFSVAAGVATRTAVSDAAGLNNARLIRASTPNLASCAVTLDLKCSVLRVADVQGILARYVDASNFLAVYVVSDSSSQSQITVLKRVAGVNTTLKSTVVSGGILELKRLRVVVTTTGMVWVYFGETGTPTRVATAQDSVLATAGALATGAVGIIDQNTVATACTRTYDNFAAWVPAIDAACFSGQSIEFRSEIYGSEGAIREDSGGTVYGQPRIVRGSRFYIPCSGSADRDTRVAVLSRRNDITLEDSPNIADNQTVEVRIRPRHLHVPRA